MRLTCEKCGFEFKQFSKSKQSATLSSSSSCVCKSCFVTAAASSSFNNAAVAAAAAPPRGDSPPEGRYAVLAHAHVDNNGVRTEADEGEEEEGGQLEKVTKKGRKKKKKSGSASFERESSDIIAAQVKSDLECREIVEELDEAVVFIDSHESEAFRECVKVLEKSKVIAYDCEGVKLSRTGKIMLLQIATSNPSKIYLLDLLTAGGDEIFNKGGLKKIVESPEILKLVYDVRMDSDALFHQHDVLMQNVLDLQILDIAIRRASGNNVERLPSLLRTVGRRLSRAEIAVCEDLKRRVKTMYTSVEDGDLWTRRPLSDDARRYATLDVWILMKLDAAMNRGVALPGFSDGDWLERVFVQSSKRVHEYKDMKIPVAQGGPRSSYLAAAPNF